MRFQNERIRKSVGLLPNVFTLGNAFFGFCSVVFTSQGDFVAASYSILLGALMDALDGRIARLTGSTSSLGLELDSLCDAISFCLAPAFLVYHWQLKLFGLPGMLVSAFFLLTGLLRLARFNITHNEQSLFFSGIPTTLAACLLATLLFNEGCINLAAPFEHFLLLLVLLLGGLMVSTFPFPTFKYITKRTYAVISVITFAFVVALGLSKVLLIAFALYFAFALFSFIQAKLTH